VKGTVSGRVRTKEKETNRPIILFTVFI